MTSEKSKREAMSEVTGFFTEVNDQFILEVSAQDTQVKYFFLELYYLRTRLLLLSDQFKIIILKF